LFNNQIPTLRDQAWTTSPSDGYPDTIFDPGVAKKNDDYGKNSSRYAPRSFRAAVRVSF